MEYLYQALIYSLIILVFFGAPLKHLIIIVGKNRKIKAIYKKPHEYYRLAEIQVGNLVFILAVFFVFWLMLRNAGTGSFNGIMIMPFLIIYIVVLIVHEVKISRLKRNKKITKEIK